MATIDEELGQIERDVRTLKIEFEQYFGGGRKRPPTDTQWRVESLIRRYNERVGELSYGQRFRFNNLARKTADNQTPITSGDASRASNSGAAGSKDERRAVFALSFSNPEHEKEKIYALYEKLIEARTQTGQRSGTPSLKDFENFVREKTKDLKHKGGHNVEYSVNIENGRVKLKARVAG